MRFSTHLAFSVLIFLILNHLFTLKNPLLYFILFILASILPDIDLHISYIGKKFRFMSLLFEFILGHRNFMHSLWPACIIFFALKPFGFEYASLGYVSHLALDSLTVKGLCLFWPFLKVKYKLHSGGILDTFLFYLFSVADLILILSFANL
jgi:inner membrane protein